MHFSDFYSVVSEVVVNHEGHVVTFSEETQHSPVICQKLFLGSHPASSQSLFQKLLHLRVLLLRNLDLRQCETV